MVFVIYTVLNSKGKPLCPSRGIKFGDGRGSATFIDLFEDIEIDGGAHGHGDM